MLDGDHLFSESSFLIFPHPDCLASHRPSSRSSSLMPCYTPPSRPLSPFSASESDSSTNTSHSDSPTPIFAPSPRDACDTRSLFAPSTYTTRSRSTVVPVRIVRRVPSSDEEPPDPGPGRPLTWPSVARIRKSVSSIFHLRRDTPPARTRPAVPRAISSRQPTTVTPKGHVRVRSVSFAGFTALAAIDGAGEGEADVDEVAEEARGVVEGIRTRWVFEEVQGEPVGSIFERDVE